MKSQKCLHGPTFFVKINGFVSCFDTRIQRAHDNVVFGRLETGNGDARSGRYSAGRVLIGLCSEQEIDDWLYMGSTEHFYHLILILC